MLFGLAGCRRSGQPKAAGSDLPITSSQSAALPGATDAADAPNAPEIAESRSADIATYRDPASGITFQYPSFWRPAVAGQSPITPVFEQSVGKSHITQEFIPEGTIYAPTVLRALMFSYTVKSGSDAAQCAAIVNRVIQGAARVTTATYGGATYTEASGEDAGMCTQVQTRVDSTLSGSRCAVFERDFVTSCPFVKSKTEPRPLTEKETTTLERQLDAVMQSVRITAQ